MMRPVKCPPDCPGRHRRGEDQQLQFSHFAIASLAPPSAEIPKSKFQIPNNFKFLSRSVGRDPGLRVDFLSLELGISLELGAWDFRSPLGERLRPWVKLPVHGFEPLLVDVRVNLRR